MTAFNGTTLTYDADGNLTNDGTNSYIWDARGHLSTLAGTNVAAYEYDAFGRRAQNTINGLMTQYLYDGLNPVEEFDGASPPNATARMLTGLNIDEYFERTDSSGTLSYLTDMLGSTMALADSSGALDTNYTYEPFGATTVNGSSGNPYQFTGRENDSTGLYYYRARYYSPTLQRFVSQDPMEPAKVALTCTYIGVRSSPFEQEIAGEQPGAEVEMRPAEQQVGVVVDFHQEVAHQAPEIEPRVFPMCPVVEQERVRPARAAKRRDRVEAEARGRVVGRQPEPFAVDPVLNHRRVVALGLAGGRSGPAVEALDELLKAAELWNQRAVPSAKLEAYQFLD